MALNGLSIADNATSLSVTGGTAQAFTPDGVLVNNGIHVAAAAVADFRVRPHISFKNKVPQRNSNGEFGYGTREFILTEPYLHTDGKVYYVTRTTTERWHPVIPAATIKNARYKCAQVMFDADSENFNSAGDLS